MRYDLKQVQELCERLGLRSRPVSDKSMQIAEVDLGGGAVLYFVDSEHDEDCLIGFKEGGWHFHDDFVFEDRDRGLSIRLNYLDLLKALKSGAVVICRRWKAGSLDYRELLHSDSHHVLGYITAVQSFPEGDEVRIWRAPR